MYIQKSNLLEQLTGFKMGKPFNHCVIDNFFDDDVAKQLGLEFPSYDSSEWFEYSNAIENKKACNNWNIFPSMTYSVLSYLSSTDFANFLSESIDETLYSDIGLHGGGWHIHSNGGNLNPHLDYSIHPKLKLQRKLNLIIYLSEPMTIEMGGEFGMWEDDNNKPGKLVQSVAPIFNRAVLFDTTQDSWHGMVSPVDCPPNVFRKSLAVYYLCEVAENADRHQRALFSPRLNQKGDKAIEQLINDRSDVRKSAAVYRDK
jgi:Rps23 Pro-64 3,4-dihydroxylase Tpa1-like proline 4-hydroxylase